MTDAEPVSLSSTTADGRWRTALVRGPVSGAAFEAIVLAVKLVRAAVFGIALLFALVASFVLYPADAPLARYDLMFLLAVGIQATLLATRLETWDEAKVILAFHLAGTAMELFKTSVGSWSYPEDNLVRIAGVPLFSGFMYAAVGSFIARAWRLFDLQFTRWPPLWVQGALAAACYLNFFTHHFTLDLRWVLFAASAAVYGLCIVRARIDQTVRAAPMLLVLLGAAGGVWIAENVATFGRAWAYPHQLDGWSPVSLSKLGSWYLLILLSFVLVAAVRGPGRATSTKVDAGGGRGRRGNERRR